MKWSPGTSILICIHTHTPVSSHILMHSVRQTVSQSVWEKNLTDRDHVNKYNIDRTHEYDGSTKNMKTSWHSFPFSERVFSSYPKDMKLISTSFSCSSLCLCLLTSLMSPSILPFLLQAKYNVYMMKVFPAILPLQTEFAFYKSNTQKY